MQINNSQNKPYYTQRNNEIKPGSACNVTAMIMALSAAGWPVDRLSDSAHSQPEDALMFFLCNDRSVRDAWLKVDPSRRILRTSGIRCSLTALIFFSGTRGFSVRVLMPWSSARGGRCHNSSEPLILVELVLRAVFLPSKTRKLADM